MRDRFVGDIGDFGKYGLLRALCGARETDCDEKLWLGVLWYLNPDDSKRSASRSANHNEPSDNRIDYLQQPDSFRLCDPLLFHTLFWIVKAEQRKVANIENSEIFPSNTVFVGDPVPRELEPRKRWLDCALKKTHDCDVVFFDPDVGLSTGMLGDQRVSKKHAYYKERADDAGMDEVGPFVDRGQSVIIWHQPAHEKEAVPLLLAEIESRFPGHEIHALTYHRVVYRAFFVISGRDHEQLLAERMAHFLEGPWGQPRSKREKPHFERIV
jgi:hypothetical protein